MRLFLQILSVVLILGGTTAFFGDAEDVNVDPVGPYLNGIFPPTEPVGDVDPGGIPVKLSETGAFLDLETMTPAPGLIPYGVNTPLWTDRAVKQRWMVIPNDGILDSDSEKIIFQPNNDWTFPAGTVLIKQFDLPVTTDPGGEVQRVETRFYILGSRGESYGVTYQWNEEGTEAFLLNGGDTREFQVYENGEVAFSQVWEYPSRGQCKSCHTPYARFALGVRTHQLNGEYYYENLGRSLNQLEYLGQLGLFQGSIGDADQYLSTFPIDDESVDLETRIRSYLDANCSSCHRPGGVISGLDMRYTTPLELQNLIEFPTQSSLSDPDNRIVVPGHHELSELYIRDASTSWDRMPPVGKNLVDQVYIDALARWIDGLAEDTPVVEDFQLFPNPSRGELNLQVNDQWQAPFAVSIWSPTGQLVSRQLYKDHLIPLEVNRQQAGVYIVEVKTDQYRVVKRFTVK